MMAPETRRADGLGEDRLVGADEVDLYEFNEAFSVQQVALGKRARRRRFDKHNVHGGAVALGHPIGASGRSHA